MFRSTLNFPTDIVPWLCNHVHRQIHPLGPIILCKQILRARFRHPRRPISNSVQKDRIREMVILILLSLGPTLGPTGITQPDGTDAILSMTSRPSALSVSWLSQLFYNGAPACLVGEIPHMEVVRGVDG